MTRPVNDIAPLVRSMLNTLSMPFRWKSRRRTLVLVAYIPMIEKILNYYWNMQMLQ